MGVVGTRQCKTCALSCGRVFAAGHAVEEKIPFAGPVNCVETLLKVKATQRSERGLPQELGQWLGETEERAMKEGREVTTVGHSHFGRRL